MKTVAVAHSPVVVDESWGDMRAQVRCPNGCWDDNYEVNYVHPMLDRLTVEETDDYTSPAGERGSWLRLPFWCEGCSEGIDPVTDEPILDSTREAFSLVIAFHKGQTFVSVIKPDGT